MGLKLILKIAAYNGSDDASSLLCDLINDLEINNSNGDDEKAKTEDGNENTSNNDNDNK